MLLEQEKYKESLSLPILAKLPVITTMMRWGIRSWKPKHKIGVRIVILRGI